MRTEPRTKWFAFLRCLSSIPLALVLSTSFVYAQDNLFELTNNDILVMVKNKLASDAIIDKIQKSRCHFDTFPPVIDELRYKGVPEEVLVAMVGAPIGHPMKRVKREEAPDFVPSKPQPKASQELIRDGATGKIADVAINQAKEKHDTASKALIELTMDTLSASTKNNIAVKTLAQPLTNPSTPESAVPTKQETHDPVAPSEQPKKVETTVQVLTNSDVIKLLRSGSSITDIVTRIRAARGIYDLSAKALRELQEAGADARVFLSMMEVNQKASASAATSTEAVQNKKPEKKNE